MDQSTKLIGSQNDLSEETVDFDKKSFVYKLFVFERFIRQINYGWFSRNLS